MRVELPLLEPSAQHSFTLLVKEADRSLIPARAPQPGEQYRFHFDMAECIGCKCCVVACNEQNGNPAHLNWRRVGELEGGVFPHAQRWHVSMGCNHCLEPSCLIGCPVEAYSKDAATGIVDHNPDQCIGCQYCTWNCSYGVPQYNADRGVVGKCDMCHSRLSAGDAPACVNACPEGAIAIEIVDIAAWRAAAAAEANAPGLPASTDSFSTTRVSVPELAQAVQLNRVDQDRIVPGDPHWSLVGFLVATQFAVGAFLGIWLLDPPPGWAAFVPLLVAQLALAAAPLHLGRPAFAWRAIRNWKTSWVSREILAMSAFAGAATAYAGALYLGWPERALLGAAAVLLGVAGVGASAKIYMVPARPSWNRLSTMAAFQLTGLVTGLRLPLALGLGEAGWLTALAAVASLAQLANAWLWYRRLRSAAGQSELRATAQLAVEPLWPVTRGYLLLSIASLALLPVNAPASLALALLSEVTARYLFFVTAVPKSVASTFLAPGGASGGHHA